MINEDNYVISGLKGKTCLEELFFVHKIVEISGLLIF
jgi:hypothetical protein